MKTTLCTLYNSLYLDKGLVVYDSLKDCAKDFELYVLCMDDKCYEVLSCLNESTLVPIKLSDFEDVRMIEARNNRSLVSYMWTCSSRLIEYIFEKYQPTICSYIDADMFFYHDPLVLVEEMLREGKSVQMIPHRFSPSKEYMAKGSGIYCVEFNTFKNDENGRKVLKEWVDQCVESCSDHFDGKGFGDQMFMDEWPKKYPHIVNVCKHPGAGIAHWNLEWYNDYDTNDHTLVYKKDCLRYDAIFFHFQSITYNSRSEINVGILEKQPDINFKLVDDFYIPYLKKIEATKKMLENDYGVNILIKTSPQSKMPFWKKWIREFVIVKYISRRLFSYPKPYIVRI